MSACWAEISGSPVTVTCSPADKKTGPEPEGLDGGCAAEPDEKGLWAWDVATECPEACAGPEFTGATAAGAGAAASTCTLEYTATRPSSTVTVVPVAFRYTSNWVPTARTVASPLLTTKGRFLSFDTWKSACPSMSSTRRSLLENSIRKRERAFKSTVEPSPRVIERRSPISVA